MFLTKIWGVRKYEGQVHYLLFACLATHFFEGAADTAKFLHCSWIASSFVGAQVEGIRI